jgi:hypothetical protein
MEDTYTETLVLMLNEQNNRGLAVLQQESIAKYWQKLHGEYSDKIYPSLPLELKNPLVFLHRYINEHFKRDHARSSFFIMIVKAMLNKDKVSFAGSQQFANYLAYNDTEKTFFSMIETLAQMSQQRTLTPAIIDEYHNFMVAADDSLANQIKAPVPLHQIFKQDLSGSDGLSIEMKPLSF